MNRHNTRAAAPAVLIAFLLAAGAGRATELYYTDFENFTAGDNRWVGTDGWVGTSTSGGVQGIVSEAVPALGKTAFLGYHRPTNTSVKVLKPFSFHPVATNRPIIELETLMGIQDSTNGYRDSFFFSFYNTGGKFLAAVRFSNEELTRGVWRLDGSNQYDTSVTFVRNELYLLHARVDFALNRWSADLSGIPLFTNAVFTATTNALTLGATGAEWQLASTNPAHYGDNWLLVGDWSVKALPKGEEPFIVRTMAPDATNRPSVTWKGDKGFDYEVEYQSTALTWQTGLPASVFSNNVSTGLITYVDHTAPPSVYRKYRVTRCESKL